MRKRQGMEGMEVELEVLREEGRGRKKGIREKRIGRGKGGKRRKVFLGRRE